MCVRATETERGVAVSECERERARKKNSPDTLTHKYHQEKPISRIYRRKAKRKVKENTHEKCETAKKNKKKFFWKFS